MVMLCADLTHMQLPLSSYDRSNRSIWSIYYEPWRAPYIASDITGDCHAAVGAKHAACEQERNCLFRAPLADDGGLLLAVGSRQ